MEKFINYNGSLVDADTKVIGADNRGFRYGDGLFETIKVLDGKILLWKFHAERLLAGMDLLQFDIPGFFTAENISEQILELCKANKHEEAARVRLTVFRGDGGLYHAKDQAPNYIIQSDPLPATASWNEKGFHITVFQDGEKSCDRFSNIKSNNFLLYAMAALHAEKNQFDDCVILNTHNHACETTIANIFCVKNETIFTPPLSEGCVAGVMRRYLLEIVRNEGYEIIEKKLTIGELKDADEIFLSNAIRGIQWVHFFDDKEYGNIFSKKIHDIITKKLC